MTVESIDGGPGGSDPVPAAEAGSGGARVGPRAPQMPWLAVYLTVKDAEASIDFYSRAFGFTPGMVLRNEKGEPQHVEMQHHGEIPVMFSLEGADDCPAQSPATLGIIMPVTFYLYHEDVDALAARARAAGATVEAEPEDMFWGDRMAAFLCPNGYRWSFATHTGRFSAPMPGVS